MRSARWSCPAGRSSSASSWASSTGTSASARSASLRCVQPLVLASRSSTVVRSSASGVPTTVVAVSTAFGHVRNGRIRGVGIDRRHASSCRGRRSRAARTRGSRCGRGRGVPAESWNPESIMIVPSIGSRQTSMRRARRNDTSGRSASSCQPCGSSSADERRDDLDAVASSRRCAVSSSALAPGANPMHTPSMSGAAGGRRRRGIQRSVHCDQAKPAIRLAPEMSSSSRYSGVPPSSSCGRNSASAARR